MQLSREQKRSRGTADDRALAARRAAWGCDCDGVSHTAGGASVSAGTRRSVDGLRSHVETVTGHRPLSCPWRAFYRPVVVDAMEAISLLREGMSDGGLGTDPPAVVMDAIGVYTRSFTATTNHFDREDAKEAKRERERAKRAGKGRRR